MGEIEGEVFGVDDAVGLIEAVVEGVGVGCEDSGETLIVTPEPWKVAVTVRVLDCESQVWDHDRDEESVEKPFA